jgi:uncharacterized protein (UPF0264 family)
MQLLISPTNLDEAMLVAAACCPIVDVKNVDEGSLGAQPVWVTQQIITAVGQGASKVSVAIGDLPNLPGTISLASYGAATLKPDYIKAGLRGATDVPVAVAMINAMVQSVELVDPDITTVACSYADYKRFDGLSWEALLEAAAQTNVNVVMLDTLIKDGQSLFDAMSFASLKHFTEQAHDAGLKVALAGSLSLHHLQQLHEINPDIIGMRGAVCDQANRTHGICKDRLMRAIQDFNNLNALPIGA